MFAEDRFETIQPIEGAKHDLSRLYYQGKYGLVYSGNLQQYQMRSVDIAFRESFKDVEVRSNTDITEWLHLIDTRRLIRHRLSRNGYNVDDPRFLAWFNSNRSDTPAERKKIKDAFLTYLSEPEFSCSLVLGYINDQPQAFKAYNGWYAEECLMLDYAGWISKAFHSEIYNHFGKQAERERLHADINHKATRIEELERMLKRQDRKLDHVIEQNNQLLDDNSDMKERLDCIHTHVKESSPIVVALNNRVSTEISNEHLLLYLTEDGYELTVKVYAVNDKTLKKRGYDVNTAFAHIEGGNSVNMQNELFKLVEENNILIEPICKRTKTFVIRSTKLNTLKRIVEYDLPERINETPNSIDDTIKTIDNKTETKRTRKPKQYMGFDERYCKKVCLKWGISKQTLTEIINGEWSTGDNELIVLHESKGLMSRVIRKGKTILKPLPEDTFKDDA